MATDEFEPLRGLLHARASRRDKRLHRTPPSQWSGVGHAWVQLGVERYARPAEYGGWLHTLQVVIAQSCRAASARKNLI